MIGRCYNKNNNGYENYGGRGIRVCDEWKDNFKNFYDWSISNGYSDNLTIDHIDNNGNYKPLNCRWATAKTQANNTRKNVMVYYNGESFTLSQLADNYNIPYKILLNRLNESKWDIEKAVTIPIRPHECIVEYNGEIKTIKEWAEIIGKDKRLLYKRIFERGWSIERAFTTNKKKYRNS